MRERKSFSDWFWGLFGIRLHYFVIDEKQSESEARNRGSYWSYRRRFWHFYKVTKLGNEKDVWRAQLETPFRKSPKENWLSIRFHIGNAGSETPWDGHLTIFGWSWYWGHSGFRGLAQRLTRCSGYTYDSRDWQLGIFDGSLSWSIAEHSDMCRKYPRYYKTKSGKRKKSWRTGSLKLSIPELIWGPKRYTYQTMDQFDTSINMPEGAYPATIKLQRVLFGRTKVSPLKHSVSWSLDVDAPKGIPTHFDHSGGWKGDRTYGFGVGFKYAVGPGWQQDAINCVKAWVYKQRGDSGFREAQVEEVEA